MKVEMIMLGICGDNCDLCPRFIATKSGDEKKLNEVAELWMRLGFREVVVSAEEIACHGCSPEIKCAYPLQRKCALDRNLENCGRCEDYPCEMALHAFSFTETSAKSWKDRCSESEYGSLEEAFLKKKEYLDKEPR
jgi:hypothetical protein